MDCHAVLSLEEEWSDPTLWPTWDDALQGQEESAEDLLVEPVETFAPEQSAAAATAAVTTSDWDHIWDYTDGSDWDESWDDESWLYHITLHLEYAPPNFEETVDEEPGQHEDDSSSGSDMPDLVSESDSEVCRPPLSSSSHSNGQWTRSSSSSDSLFDVLSIHVCRDDYSIDDLDVASEQSDGTVMQDWLDGIYMPPLVTDDEDDDGPPPLISESSSDEDGYRRQFLDNLSTDDDSDDEPIPPPPPRPINNDYTLYDERIIYPSSSCSFDAHWVWQFKPDRDVGELEERKLFEKLRQKKQKRVRKKRRMCPLKGKKKRRKQTRRSYVLQP